jgi:aminoglycoside phosphotransferase
VTEFSAAAVRSTHVLEMADDRVIKRFRSWSRGEHQWEWQALTTLAEFAPGLAPVPLDAALDADPPSITMTRLPGEPLAGQTVTSLHLDALAAALNQLHKCLPPRALARVRPQPWLAVGAMSRLRHRTAGMRDLPDGEPVVRAAFGAAARWIDQAAEPAEPLTFVFGQNDSNLANFLWDGSRVRLVDFEDSGLSDRASELACLAEHISTWRESGIDADDLLGRFDLTAAESARVRFWRRGYAIFWLHLVHKRPGPVAAKQAERVLTLLGT